MVEVDDLLEYYSENDIGNIPVFIALSLRPFTQESLEKFQKAFVQETHRILIGHVDKKRTEFYELFLNGHSDITTLISLFTLGIVSLCFLPASMFNPEYYNIFSAFILCLGLATYLNRKVFSSIIKRKKRIRYLQESVANLYRRLWYVLSHTWYIVDYEKCMSVGVHVPPYVREIQAELSRYEPTAKCLIQFFDTCRFLVFSSGDVFKKNHEMYLVYKWHGEWDELFKKLPELFR